MHNNRPWLRWVGYIAGGLLALVFLLACIGFIYEQIEENRDRRLNHPPGLMVDVGGYRMHLYCIGRGSPTVVLDSGLGDDWLGWYKVQPQISQYTRVCSYDRAGLGWSDPSPQPRTCKVFAQELHTLLHQAAIPGPYILAGHSLGGHNVQMYAGLYPAEVAGIILVDSPHGGLKRMSPRFQQWETQYYREFDVRGRTMPFGIPRLMGWCGGTDTPELRSMARTVDCQRKYFREVHEEWTNFDEDASQVQTIATLGNMPLVVLSNDPDKLMPGIPVDLARDFNDTWERMQEELAHLSSNSSHIIAKGSTHYIQIDTPDVVIEAVRDVVDQWRVTHPGSAQ